VPRSGGVAHVNRFTTRIPERGDQASGQSPSRHLTVVAHRQKKNCSLKYLSLDGSCLELIRALHWKIHIVNAKHLSAISRLTLAGAQGASAQKTTPDTWMTRSEARADLTIWHP
jgi:hypothetical protein